MGRERKTNRKKSISRVVREKKEGVRGKLAAGGKKKIHGKKN